MLVKNGNVVSECWWQPYGAQYRHQMFSLSKSFTSSAIGMLVEEGKVTVDTLLSGIFKDEFAEIGNRIDEKMERMTLKHLLMMGTGVEYEDWNGENHIKAFLASHVRKEPGSSFYYNTLATYMQSAVVTRITGQKLVDYLKPRLFEPLGIDPYWEEDNAGINMGGFGLNVKTEDIAKLGQLYLQKGLWDGKRLISEQWVEAATSKQIDNSPGRVLDWAQGYGYQFWRCVPQNVYRGDGAYGQYCIVMPDQNAVIAITSNADMQLLLNDIWEILLPEIEGTTVGAPGGDYDKLVKISGELSYLKTNPSPLPFPQFRKEYKQVDGTLKVYFEFSGGECIFEYDFGSGPKVFSIENGTWTKGVIRYSDHGNKHFRIQTYGEWPDENTFKMTLWCYESPVHEDITALFNADKSEVELILHFAGEQHIKYKSCE